ncbi:MAG: lactonase family protein [Ginsengibacter sp.]
MRLLFLFLFSTTCLFSTAQTFTLFIGTYTGSGSKGIYVYKFNANTGKAEWVSNTDSASNPSYLAVSKNGKYVYAANETGGTIPGQVSSYAFDKATGKLSFINSQLSGGDHPCYVSVTNNNKWLAVANYSGGSASIYAIDKDGTLEPSTQFIQDTGSSVNKSRQDKPHVHSAVFSPDERFLFTPDLGTDKVLIYSFNQSSGEPLKSANPAFAKVPPGNGPRHFTFHPNKKLAYLVEEISGSVSAFRYKNGNLQFIQRLNTHPKKYRGKIGSADIHLSPDGKFLYVSNRGDENTITIFSINAATGKMALKGYQSTLGKTPRNFMIDPTGNFLLVANQDTDNIVVFKRNKQTGLLKSTGEEIKIPRPVCLKMIK